MRVCPPCNNLPHRKLLFLLARSYAKVISCDAIYSLNFCASLSSSILLAASRICQVGRALQGRAGLVAERATRVCGGRRNIRPARGVQPSVPHLSARLDCRSSC